MSDYMGEYTAMRELLVKADAEVGLQRAEPLREAIEQWKATEENGGVLGRGAWRDGVRYGLEVAAQLAAGLLAEPTDQDQRETRTEWGVESRTFAGGEWDGLETDHISSYDDALLCIARWYPQPGRARVVCREVGPWVEAPDPSP